MFLLFSCCCCCCQVASVVSDSVQPHRRQPTRLLHSWDSPGKNTGVGCHFLLQCMKVKSESEVAQSCPTLSNLTDCSLPGSPVHGILQARVLEWGAIAFSGSVTKSYQLFEISCTAACHSLSFTNSWSLLKLISTEMMPSNHLILCHPFLLLPSIFPSIGSFPMTQFFASGGQSIGASASASVLPMNIQGCFSLGLTGLISLLSKGLSRVFSSTI